MVAQKAATLQILSDGRSIAELPGPTAFDAASQFVREEDVASAIPCGDDVGAVLEAAKDYADAGFTHLALVQIGGSSRRRTSSGAGRR